MRKSVNKGISVPKIPGFWSKFLKVLGDISIILSFVFIFIGLGNQGWELFSSAAFWSTINSMWLFAFLLFYFSLRTKR